MARRHQISRMPCVCSIFNPLLVALVCSLTATAVSLSRRAIARANPELSDEEVGVKFVEHRLLSKTVDLAGANTIVFHLPDGDAFALPVDGMDGDLELGLGKVFDTSAINGEIHYFPRGNA